jgi:hypothetical protein
MDPLKPHWTMAVIEEVASVMKKYLPHRSVSVFPIQLRRRFARTIVMSLAVTIQTNRFNRTSSSSWRLSRRKLSSSEIRLFFITTSCFSKDYLVICGGCYWFMELFAIWRFVEDWHPPSNGAYVQNTWDLRAERPKIGTAKYGNDDRMDWSGACVWYDDFLVDHVPIRGRLMPWVGSGESLKKEVFLECLTTRNKKIYWEMVQDNWYLICIIQRKNDWWRPSFALLDVGIQRFKRDQIRTTKYLGKWILSSQEYQRGLTGLTLHTKLADVLDFSSYDW